MHNNSDFASPGIHEYANVRALNAAWLLAATDMKGPQRGRMASTPFLLFSVRENDLGWWEAALSEDPQQDLLAATPTLSAELVAVQMAALAFLWQLVRINPYAARVISGASAAWCDEITKRPLVALLEKVAWRADMTVPRLQLTEDCADLPPHVASSRRAVRDASQRVALQELLCSAHANETSALPAAACAMPRPLRVADRYAERRKKV
ncbi:MAG: hypothetical protein K0U72_05850 [Gammaproteobacteria bacterium]|nr:hypothetical protein [Gammaproteobacteria bacterium]